MISAAEMPLMAVFAAVVRRGSFSGAAREVGLSKSVISERVKLLEERCSARLLERTTRRLRLTDAGQLVLAAMARLEDTVGELSRTLDLNRAEPSGVLRVATTADLGPLLVGPVAARFVTRYPKVRVEVLSNDLMRDMLEARIDIAVRIGNPNDSSLVIRRLARLPEPIVAAPSLVQTLGPIHRPRDLASAPWVRHSLAQGAGALRFTGPGGRHDEVVPTVRALADSGATLLALLLHGAGVGVLPLHLLREPLASGRLVQLCPGWVWKTVTLHAMFPSRQHQRPVVQEFVAALQEQFAEDEARWGLFPRSRTSTR